MDTLSPHAPEDKPHYTYTLEYPEDYPDQLLAGTAFYVGKGSIRKDGHDRINDHEVEARSKGRKDTNKHKINTIKKIWDAGYQIVKKKLAFFATHEEACMYEIALIFFLPNLTNLTAGGDGTLGYVMSEEARQKIRNRVFSEETRRRWSQIRKGKPIPQKRPRRKGRKLSEEHKLKLSLVQKGKPKSKTPVRKPMREETKRRISEVKKHNHKMRKERFGYAQNELW